MSALDHIDDDVTMCEWVYEHREAVIAGWSIDAAAVYLRELTALSRAVSGKRKAAVCRAMRPGSA